MPGPRWVRSPCQNRLPTAGQRLLQLQRLLEPPGVAAVGGPEQPVPVASVRWEWWWSADRPVQSLLHLKEGGGVLIK